MPLDASNAASLHTNIDLHLDRLYADAVAASAGPNNPPKHTPKADDIVSWNFNSVSQSRGMRVAGLAFRIARNASAIGGLLFFYLLIHGYSQYVELQKAASPPCAVSRCS